MPVTLASILAAEPATKVPPVPTWVWLMLIAAAGVACVTDMRSMRIPNWLTLPLLAAGLAYAGITNGGTGLLHATAGAAIAGMVFVLGYVAFGGGAGDAKLMLAFGSWIGINASMTLMLGVTIAGFFQALIVVATRGGLSDIPLAIFDGWLKVYMTGIGVLRGQKPTRPLAADGTETPAESRHKGWFPYAPAILLGTVGTWWYCVKFQGMH
jgi:prepilin peptidase CpaA